MLFVCFLTRFSLTIHTSLNSFPKYVLLLQWTTSLKLCSCFVCFFFFFFTRFSVTVHTRLNSIPNDALEKFVGFKHDFLWHFIRVSINSFPTTDTMLSDNVRANLHSFPKYYVLVWQWTNALKTTYILLNAMPSDLSVQVCTRFHTTRFRQRLRFKHDVHCVYYLNAFPKIYACVWRRVR